MSFSLSHSRPRLVVGGDTHTKTSSLCWGALNGAGTTQLSHTLLDGVEPEVAGEVPGWVKAQPIIAYF